MYDDLAEIFVFVVTAAYVILFVVLAIYFLRNGIRARDRKKTKQSATSPPRSTTTPS